jgi:serine acetyltransferase
MVLADSVVGEEVDIGCLAVVLADMAVGKEVDAGCLAV